MPRPAAPPSTSVPAPRAAEIHAAPEAPACEVAPSILAPCDEASGTVLEQIVAALDAAGIEHEPCVRVKLEVLEHEPYDFTGFCAGPPALVEDIFGHTNVRLPLRMYGEGVPGTTELVVGATADEIAVQYGRTAWVEGADPNDRRTATRILARLREGLTAAHFESVELGRIYLRYRSEGGLYIAGGGRTLVVDLGSESIVCVSREVEHLACAVLAVPDLRLESAKPRNVRLDLEDGSDVDARLFVSFGGASRALNLRIPESGAPVATAAVVRGGFPRDGHPWWWPTAGLARLERAQPILARHANEAERALAAELHGLLGRSLLDVIAFEGGAVYLLSSGGGGDLDFHRSVSGMVLRSDEAPRFIALVSSDQNGQNVVLTEPHDLRGRAGALALGFFGTISVQASAEGDVRRFEEFLALVTREDGHLAFGPGLQIGVERDESVHDGLVLWRGFGRSARWCGETCLTLGAARAWVGEYRGPDFNRIRGMRPRNERDDAEDEAVFTDPDAEPPTAEEQREMEAERARLREEARPREVDVGTLRGSSLL